MLHVSNNINFLSDIGQAHSELIIIMLLLYNVAVCIWSIYIYLFFYPSVRISVKKFSIMQNHMKTSLYIYECSCHLKLYLTVVYSWHVSMIFLCYVISHWVLEISLVSINTLYFFYLLMMMITWECVSSWIKLIWFHN